MSIERCKLRRMRLFADIPPASLVILPSNPTAPRSHDTEHPYRQNSDVIYLSGFEEQDSILVMQKLADGSSKTILFVQPRDPEKESWTGKRVGPERAPEWFGVDEAFVNTELEQWVGEAFKEAYTLYYSFGTRTEVDQVVLGALKSVKRHRQRNYVGVRSIINPMDLIHESRLIKDDEELKVMRRAAEISVEAHSLAMKAMSPGIMEYEIEAVVNGHFRKCGGFAPAYTSICASGDNATILHYVENNEECKDGELFLIDAGAEYKYYAADISRTYPVNGKFTHEQKQVYEVVLKAFKASIDHCRVGNTFQSVHDLAVRFLTEGLVELGVLEGDIDELIKEEKYKPFFMHRIGHWLGLDTHDVGFYKLAGDPEAEDRPLKPNMVLTIEPGLYFTPNCEDVPEKYRGIGVRIEDNVLVTAEGPEVLTVGLPVEISEIESLMRS